MPSSVITVLSCIERSYNVRAVPMIEKARTKSKHTASARRRASWASATFMPMCRRLIVVGETSLRRDMSTDRLKGYPKRVNPALAILHWDCPVVESTMLDMALKRCTCISNPAGMPYIARPRALRARNSIASSLGHSRLLVISCRKGIRVSQLDMVSGQTAYEAVQGY